MKKRRPKVWSQGPPAPYTPWWREETMEMFNEMRNRPLYYNQRGQPIRDPLKWAVVFGKRLEGRANRKRVQVRSFTDSHLVSTVWLGLDQSMMLGPPLMFETQLFCMHETPCEMDLARWKYPSKRIARIMHTRLKRAVKKQERMGLIYAETE